LAPNWSWRTHLEITHNVLFFHFISIILLILDSVDENLSTLESLHMIDLFSGEFFLKLEFDLVYIDS
jgi:hypothetical protein